MGIEWMTFRKSRPSKCILPIKHDKEGLLIRGWLEWHSLYGYITTYKDILTSETEYYLWIWLKPLRLHLANICHIAFSGSKLL